MLAQIEQMVESDTKIKLLHNIEVKIVDLQTKLRTIHDQIESNKFADKQSPPPAYHPHGGYRAHGGRFGGSRFPGGGRGFFAPQGVGRGRGRGGYYPTNSNYSAYNGTPNGAEPSGEQFSTPGSAVVDLSPTMMTPDHQQPGANPDDHSSATEQQ
jgi:hypothetical protein